MLSRPDKKNKKNETGKTFSKVFPPPLYLSMPSVGINISDHSIKMLELRDASDHFDLGDYATFPLPQGAVIDGKIKKPEEVIAVLKELKKEFNLEFVRSSIPEEEGYIFSLPLPGVEEKNLYSALEFRISDNVPLAPSEAVFDYSIIGKPESALEVNVGVLPRSVVDTHVKVFEGAGLIPLSLEIEAQTIARSVIDVHSEKTYLIADIGRTRTGIAIADHQVVRYTSTLATGGDRFVALIRDEEKISQEEAEKKKERCGIVPLEYSEDLAQELKVAAENISTEFSSRIEYWNSQASKNSENLRPVSGIILCGGNATMPGLKEYLSALLQIPVEIGNVWRNVFSFDEIIPPIDFNHSLGYASAIGLALMG